MAAEQASWRPGPRRKSIWDLTLHIAYWNYAVRRRLADGSESRGSERFDRTPSNWPRPVRSGEARAWAADVALLRAEHEKLVRAIASVTPSQLERKPSGRGEWTYAELILGIAQHDAYHTGQIQLMKRLWAEHDKRCALRPASGYASHHYGRCCEQSTVETLRSRTVT